MAFNKLHAVISAGYVLLQAGIPLSALAQSADNANLDLGSKDRTVSAGSNFQQTNITRDGAPVPVVAGQLLTPAEFVALSQVLQPGGNQSIVLAGTGAAIGGTVSLAGFANHLSNLHIPTGVTVISDAAAGPLNISGNLTNSGALYAISTNTAYTSALISASNIFNTQGALLTSILPTGGLAGFGSAISGLHLSLTAVHDIINAGTISSAASLTMSAGGSIVNALPMGISGAQPVLQAIANLNLISSQLTNAGLISSLTGNINLSSLIAQDILIKNAGGTFSALNGSLNIRDAAFAGKYNLDILGGDVIAKELNLFSGNGKINVAVNELIGKVNVMSNELAINANTPTLRMGNVIVTGDPIITNDSGDVLIEPDFDQSFTTGGGPLIVSASRNIIATAGIIDTAGGQIDMTAGNTIDLSATMVLNSKNGSGVGGPITLKALGGNILLNQQGTVSSGGSISLTAAGSIDAGNLSTTGSAIVLQAGGTVATGNISSVSNNKGGGVDISAQLFGGATPFIVGASQSGRNVNGVNGNIVTTGNNISGFVSINNGGSGDIVVTPNSINVQGPKSGGDIALNAGSGNIIFGEGTLSTTGGFGYSSGFVFLSAANIILDNTTIDASGFIPGSVFTSSSTISYSGNVTITTAGEISGGRIQLMPADSLTISTTFNQTTGEHHLIADGATNYSNPLSITGSGTALLDAGGASGGGAIRIAGGDISISGGALTLNASATNDGFGGLIEFDTISFDNTATITATSNGAGSGGGGLVSVSVNTLSPNLKIGSGSGLISMIANGGDFGDGGTVDISAAGAVDLDLNGISASAGANGFSGGHVNVTAGFAGSGDLTVASGTLSVDGFYGGSIFLESQSPSGNVVIGPAVVLSTNGAGSGGIAGSIDILSAHSLTLGGTLTANGTGDGSAGIINVQAGTSTPGALNLTANISANAAGLGNAGQVTVVANSATPAVLSGSLSASATGSGSAGQIIVSRTDSSNLDMSLTGTLTAAAAAGNGKVELNQAAGNVSLTGSGEIIGDLKVAAKAIDINMSKNGTALSLQNVSSSAGAVTIRATGTNSTIKVIDSGIVFAAGGVLTLGAANVRLGNNSHLNMDAAGLMTIDSGSPANSLTLYLPENGTAFIAMPPAGANARPGAVLVTPRDGGSATFTSSGSGVGSLEITGATLSGSTTGGNLTVGSNASISSDSFDELLNFGIELTSVSGNVNLLGAVSTSHLSLSTTGGGSVLLGSEINSPTVVISTTGNGTITQTAGQTIGIGSLTLSSELGNIGSQTQALNTNVLELKVISGANVFLSNDSSVDIKTSTVQGTFNLTNNGDVSFESAVGSRNLNVSATGSISVLNTVQGDTGIHLSAAGANTSINVTGTLLSSAGNISLATDSLTYSGIIETQAAGGHIDIAGGSALSITSTSGQMRATSDGVVTFTATNTINLPASATVNIGSNGSLSLVTTAGASSAINIGGSGTATLQVSGGGLLNMVASSVTLANGSTVRVDRASGTALAMGPSGANTPFTLHLSSSSGGHLVTAGGAVQIAAGANAPLVFDNNGQLVSADLTISGGALSTTSTNADTYLNNVNIVSDNNISINVHGGTLNMGGDIASSRPDGVIALLDPGGLTVGGNGNISFINGGHGQILVGASGAGNNLTFTGHHTFNDGPGGKTDIRSDAGVIFGANANLTVNNGPVTVTASTLSFQQSSALTASSTVSLTGSGLQIIGPGGGQATVSAVGAISISSTAGTALTFSSSASGQDAILAFAGAPLSIQTSNANVTVNPNMTLHADHDINISTPGGTFINNGHIEAPNQNNTITIEASGNLLVNHNVKADNIVVRTIAHNGNITLASDLEATHKLLISANGSGSIYQQSGTLKADELVLQSGSGNIGTDDRSIKFTANSVQVTTNGSAWLEAKTNVQVASATVGNKFHLNGQGSITVGQNGISADRVRIDAATSIIVNGRISGTTRVKLIAENGSISGNGEVSGHKVVLRTDHGGIGSAANPLHLKADILKVNIEHSGSAFISETDALTIEKVKVAGGFTLTAGGDLSVNDVHADNGSLTLVSASSIHLEDGSHLYANEGNILIQSQDKSHSSTIRIGKNSDIEAYASSTGRGNVTVVVGDVPATAVKGTAPGGVTVSKKWGGEVYFGKNGITASGKKNEIDAWGSNVTFSTGTRAASAIVLEGNVEIMADPPPAPSIDAPIALQGVSIPQANMMPSLQLPVFATPMVMPSFQLSPARKDSLIIGERYTEKEPVCASSTNDSASFTAVAFATAPAMTAARMASPAQTFLGEHADIRQAKNTDLSVSENGHVSLRHGEALVQARKAVTITAGSDRIVLARGSVALVRKNDESLEVFNLYEPHSGAVEVVLKDRHSVKVGVGTSFSTGQATLALSVASRHRHEHTVEKCKTQSAEYSLLSLASRAEIVSALLGSRDKREQQLVERLLKMAAALSMVTGGHGPYSDKQQ